MAHTKGKLEHRGLSIKTPNGDWVADLQLIGIGAAKANEKEREANAAELVKRWNMHDDLLLIAKAYRNLLAVSAETDGQVQSFHHIEGILNRAKQGGE